MIKLQKQHQLLFVLLLVVGIIVAGTNSVKLFPNGISQVFADEVDDLQKQINELEKLKQLSEDATKPLEAEVDSLEKRISNARASIVKAKKEAADLALQIKQKEEDLTVQYQIFSRRITQQYKRLRTYSPLIAVLATESAADLSKDLAYRDSVKNQDNQFIKAIGEDIKSLQADKQRLENNQVQLVSLEKKLDEQADFFKGEIRKAKDYQKDLTGKIADLSALQQTLLAARSGNFSVSIGDATLADDYDASLVGWQEKAPSNSVTVFSFGAYAANGSNKKRNGMSQFGAKARADSGQSYVEILQAYYPGSQLVDYPVMNTIVVDSYGSKSFEDNYLKGIHEISESWPVEAQKAQAIAARTFAVKYTSNGQSSICPTDYCQVYKPDIKSGDWARAVDETRGKILVDSSGNPISTQYVSTPGGYLDTKGWDTTCGDSSCLANGAWDAKSPWFYKAWYTHYKYVQGSGGSYSTCKRSNPWLSQEDITDILNSWLVLRNGSSEDVGRILPPDGCGGGSPFSIEEMKNKAGQFGGAYSSVNSIRTEQSNNGYTNAVIFQTNRGEVRITGFDTSCSHSGSCQDFWTLFNLRAPGNLSIKNRMFDLRFK